MFSPLSYGLELSFNLIVAPGHTGTGIIQVHYWNQPPNNNLDGRIWHKELPVSGGSFKIKPGENRLGISFFQRNPTNQIGQEQVRQVYDEENGYYYNDYYYEYLPFWDCCCVELDNLNQLITIKSF